MTGSEEYKNYVKNIKANKIKVCNKMKAVISRHLEDLKRDDIYLDYSLIDDIYSFSKEHIKHVKGDLAKQAYILEPFQIFIVGSIFAWKKKVDDSRRFSKSFIFLARGNAKTDLAAIAALYEYYKSAKIGQEIIMLATTKEQAGICFKRAADMISFDSVLSKYSKTSKARYYNYKEKGTSRGEMRALASESDTLDGQRVSFAILDEIHAYKKRSLFDVIKSSQGTMKNTHLIMITTAGFITTGFCMDEYVYAQKILEKKTIADEEFVYIAELDKIQEWKDPDMYIKANPNIGKSVILEKLIEDRDKAMVDTEAKKSFITKHCNIFLNADRRHFDYQLFKDNTGTFDAKQLGDLTWYGGVDLSNRLDLTSVSLVAFDKEENLYIINKSFIPEAQIKNKEKYDRMKVLSWKKEGYLEICSGNSVDYDYVHKFFNVYRELGLNIRFIGFDRWGAATISEVMEEDGYKCFDIPQGAITFSNPMREFEILMLDQKIYHNNNELLSWAIGNIIAVKDANDNIRPDKSKSTERIDPFIATLNALYLAIKFKNKEDEKLAWLEEDVINPFI